MSLSGSQRVGVVVDLHKPGLRQKRCRPIRNVEPMQTGQGHNRNTKTPVSTRSESLRTGNSRGAIIDHAAIALIDPQMQQYQARNYTTTPTEEAALFAIHWLKKGILVEKEISVFHQRGRSDRSR